MNNLPTKRGTCGLLVLLALLLSACGTFQIEAEPSASDGLTAGSATSNVEPTLVDVAMATDATQEIQVTEQVAPATRVIMTTTVARNTPNREELFLPACYDFDAGASLTPPDPGCDFTFLPGPDSGTIEIYPVAPAQLAYGAVIPEEPGPAECAENGAFSTDPEVVAPLAAMYVCFRTGEGRVGYLHFTAADLEQAYSVTFDWLVFDQDDGNMGHAAEPDLNYENEAFGIQLTFPESWSGVEASQNGNADVTSICFTFIGSAPVCVLQIDVYDKAAWSNLEEIPDGYYLGENDKFVFAAGPYDSECIQLDEFQCARYQEIPAVLSTLVIE